MNIFGTDGIRKKIGVEPFTPETLPRLGRAIALWINEQYGPNVDILLARDTRESGSWASAALASGLLRSSISVHQAHVLPTPGVFHLMKEQPNFVCGIVISASHNEAEDNGIKIMTAEGKLTEKDELRISELYHTTELNEPTYSYGAVISYKNAEDNYKNILINHFPPLALQGHKVVLDCAHGATYRIAPAVFRALGAEVTVLFNSPDGKNINKGCGAVHPEALQKAVIEQEALIGCAFDGDGDRLTVVNKHGVVKDGDDILAFLMGHPTYQESTGIVSTIMANEGLASLLQESGKKLIRTQVGDKHVIKELQGRRLLLGGEPSGHIILNDIAATGDGILAALRVIQTMLYTENYTMDTFTRFPQVTLHVPVTEKKDLTKAPVADLIAACKAQLSTGRLVVRYSGTEPKLRIMVEDPDTEVMNLVAYSLAKELGTLLS